MNDSAGGRKPGSDPSRPKEEDAALMDIFDAEDTKRVSPEMLRSTLRAESAAAAPLEPRDYRPVRGSRV